AKLAVQNCSVQLAEETVRRTAPKPCVEQELFAGGQHPENEDALASVLMDPYDPSTAYPRTKNLGKALRLSEFLWAPPRAVEAGIYTGKADSQPEGRSRSYNLEEEVPVVWL